MKSLIEKHKNKLPEAYLEFITKNENFFGYIDDEFGYVHLWDISELHEAWEILEIRDRLDNTWFPIGSNGGGEMIVIKLSAPTKPLFYIPFISTSDKNADLYCSDFLNSITL